MSSSSLASKFPIVKEGKCKCGAVSIQTLTPSMLVYNCHCSHCRSFSQEDYCRAGLYWSFAVRVKGPVEEKKTTGLPGIALTRTKCRNCKQGICDWGNQLVQPLAFPSADILNIDATMNIFYDSGVKKETMGLTTIYGDLNSLVVHAVPIFTRGIPQLFVLAFKWVRVVLFGGEDGHSGVGVKND